MFNINNAANYKIIEAFVNPEYNPRFTDEEETIIVSSLSGMNEEQLQKHFRNNLCDIKLWKKYLSPQEIQNSAKEIPDYNNSVYLLIQDLLRERYSYISDDKRGTIKVDNSKISTFVHRIFKIIMNRETGELHIFNFCKGIWQHGETPILRLIYEMINKSMGLNWYVSLEKGILDEIKRQVSVVETNRMNQKGFPFANATLDYETLTMCAHNPDYMSTIASDVIYDPNASCPIFMKMLNIWFNGQADTQLFVQEWFGYCLSGNHKANAFLLVYGEGGEGKSTCFDTLAKLIGSLNTSSAPLSNLNTDFGLEPLVSKKLNYATESGNGAFHTSKLKAITAGEKITVNRKNLPETDMILKTKLVFLLNELPQLNDNSRGFARRLLILPFLNKVSSQQQDKDLSKKLDKELSGILNWALIGLYRLHNNNYNFTISKTMYKMQNQYLSTADVMELFIRNKIRIDNTPDCKILTNDVISEFFVWARPLNIPFQHLTSPRKFWLEYQRASKVLGLHYIRSKSNGKYFLKGIKII